MRRRRRKESRLRPLEAKENRPAAPTWLEQRTIVIDISNVGAAIPLTFGMEGISVSRDSSAIPAFLFSVQSIMQEFTNSPANSSISSLSSLLVDGLET